MSGEKGTEKLLPVIVMTLSLRKGSRLENNNKNSTRSRHVCYTVSRITYLDRNFSLGSWRDICSCIHQQSLRKWRHSYKDCESYIRLRLEKSNTRTSFQLKIQVCKDKCKAPTFRVLVTLLSR